MNRYALFAILLPLAFSTTLVRVDSRQQGRTFIIDLDRPEIRKALRDVAAAPRAGSLPEWLPPFPGAVRVDRPGSPSQDFAYLTYRTAAAPDVVFAHYESALRNARVTITYTNREAGRGGAIHCEDGTRTATVSVSPGVGPTDIVVNWQPKTVTAVLPASARLETLWFDDATTILRLRDPATGKEYELDGAAMVNYANKATPLEASARADFPVWLVVYPGAKIDVANGPPPGWKPQKFIDMRSYNIEMETQASVAEVAAFYRDTMIRNGLKIERETQSQDWGYSLQARTADRTHLVGLEVLKRAKETFMRLSDSYTLPRP